MLTHDEIARIEKRIAKAERRIKAGKAERMQANGKVSEVQIAARLRALLLEG